MTLRQIVLDTETTGLVASEDRIIEIGCIEIIDRINTGRTYHKYINPMQKIDAEAYKVHGISNEFLEDKPVFADIIDEFMEFIAGAELLIHNASFDVGFIEAELKRAQYKIKSLTEGGYCKVLDTLKLAKEKHPGMKNNLDALCKRYDISNAHRDLHGALLDSELLGAVYLKMTSVQNNLFAESSEEAKVDQVSSAAAFHNKLKDLPLASVTDEMISEHNDYLEFLKEQAGNCVWLDEENK